MTDTLPILVAIMLTLAIAFPVGVAAGRRQERERWERFLAKRARQMRERV